MIAPDSDSYPVLGAALENGIDYGLALAYVDSARAYTRAPSIPRLDRAMAAWNEMQDRHGVLPARAFGERIRAAHKRGVMAP